MKLIYILILMLCKPMINKSNQPIAKFTKKWCRGQCCCGGIWALTCQLRLCLERSYRVIQASDGRGCVSFCCQEHTRKSLSQPRCPQLCTYCAWFRLFQLAS